MPIVLSSYTAKMTYLQPHRRPYQRFARIVGSVVVIAFVVCAIILIFAPHVFSGLFTAIARPFWRMEFSISSGSLKSPERLLAENESLKNQLFERNVAYESLNSLESENKELKQLLGRGEDLSDDVMTASTSVEIPPFVQDKILAAVLERPPVSLYDELIIDIGLDHSISTSSLVYAVGDVLIGSVVDVLANTSKVRLFSSPGQRYDVMIGSTHVPATALGRGGGQYGAQVSRETPVREGDFVISPSFDNRPFGIITAVISDPAQPFETVLFAPSINIYQLRWVLVDK